MQHFSEKNHRGIPRFVLGNTRFFWLMFQAFPWISRSARQVPLPILRGFQRQSGWVDLQSGGQNSWYKDDQMASTNRDLQEAHLSIRFSIQTKDDAYIYIYYVYVNFCLRWNFWRFACAKSGAPEPKRPLLVSVAARKNGALKLECTSLIIHEQHGHRASAGCFIYEVWIPFSNFIRGIHYW